MRTRNISSIEGPDDERRQPTLVVRWETRTFWIALAARLRCTETQAAILLDICQNARAGEWWTSYSRDRSFYGAIESRLLTYRRVVAGVDDLDERDLIVHDRRKPTPRGCGRQSAMRPTNELMHIVDDVVAGVGRLVPCRPERTVILRDQAGRNLDFEATRETRRMEAFLREMNEALRSTSVRTGNENLDACLHRVFNGSFDRGGRAYAVGGAWQSLPSEQRCTITIGGEPTVELDYKSMHLGMLYADAGIDLTEDPYLMGEWDRGLAKLGCLVLLNANDLHQAAWSLSRKAAMSSVAAPGSPEAEKAARRLVQDVRERHQEIAGSFGTDAGARLMRRDSDIAESVMADMLKQGHVVLPMHDGFIVEETAAEVLEEAMRRALDTAGLGSIGVQRKGSKTVEKEGSDSFLFNELGTKRSDIVLLSSPSSSSPSGQNKTPSTSFDAPTLPDKAPCERSELRTPPKADDFIGSSLNSEPSVSTVEATHLASSTGSISTFDTRQTHDVSISAVFPSRTSAFLSAAETPTIFDSDASLADTEIRLDMPQPDLFPTASADPSTSTLAVDTAETLQDGRTSHEATSVVDAAVYASTSPEILPSASQSSRVGFRLEQDLSLNGKLAIWSEGEDCSGEAVRGRPCILRHDDGAGRRTTRRFADWASCKVVADDIRCGSAFVRTTFNGRYDPTPKPVAPRGMGFVERWRAGLIKRDDQEWAPILRMLPGATIREVRLRDECQN